MKLGVQLPEVERVVRRDELAAIARAVEEQGFDSLWVGDHLLYRAGEREERGPWDCFTTLAWLAGITHMRWWRFFLWNAAGGIAWATLVGLLAYYFGRAAADAVAHYGLLGAIVVIVAGALVVIGLRIWHTKIET